MGSTGAIGTMQRREEWRSKGDSDRLQEAFIQSFSTRERSRKEYE